MTDTLDNVLRLAKDCHTKQAWESLFERFGDSIESSSQSRPLSEIFRLLKADAQSMQYHPSIWGKLISGCLTCWNLELGQEIAEFTKKLPTPEVAIPATKVYLEAGHLSLARKIAQRVLRTKNLSELSRLELQLLICTSYGEQRKKSWVLRLLNELAPQVRDADIDLHSRAKFLSQLGRMYYLLGQYVQAGELYRDGAKLYLSLQDWENTARNFYNAGGCYHNSGGANEATLAFPLIEESRRICETHNLLGPLSHVETFYGLIDYQHGHFAGARDHLRRALELLPQSDKGQRRLHVLSMLSLTYLAQGRYHQAKRYGRMTLDLAALDESNRLRSRFESLEAELLWEDGLILESQSRLKNVVLAFEERGVHNLEELSTLSRWAWQQAQLGESLNLSTVTIEPQLKKHAHTWCSYVQAIGNLQVNRGEYAAAHNSFEQLLKTATAHSDVFHIAQAHLGLCSILLRQFRGDEIDANLQAFEVAVAKIGDTSLRTWTYILHAAKAYQKGDFTGTTYWLKSAAKSPRKSFLDGMMIDAVNDTLEGRSPRLTMPWHYDALARFSRTFFAPSFEPIDKANFRISKNYTVHLEKYPVLAELLHYLLSRSRFSATPAEIQEEVWKESLNNQGWQQKIRNTIMRLRDFLPQTIAPIIVQSDNSIKLFCEAIEVQLTLDSSIASEQEILRLIQDTPMSTGQLSNRLNISAATTKRILKKLADADTIKLVRNGRNIVYAPAVERPPENHPS